MVFSLGADWMIHSIHLNWPYASQYLCEQRIPTLAYAFVQLKQWIHRVLTGGKNATAWYSFMHLTRCIHWVLQGLVVKKLNSVVPWPGRVKRSMPTRMLQAGPVPCCSHMTLRSLDSLAFSAIFERETTMRFSFKCSCATIPFWEEVCSKR